MIQLVCTHCHHRFELEKKEGALCPSCGWSSSIVSAAELQDRQSPSGKKQATSQANLVSRVGGFLFFALKFLAIAGLLFCVLFFGIRFLNSQRGAEPGRPETQKVTSPIRLDASQTKSSAPAPLSADEIAFLNSKIEVSPSIQLEDADQNLLQRAVDLKSGNVEKLPSGSWTFEQFEQFVTQQEKTYKLPLPRGYKKNLEELFQKTYAQAYNLFLSGKIQESRDAYVASLAFPVYNNDIRKHRAVVLTMLKSYINDTIAKVGSMNFALARQHSVHLAEQVSVAYAVLQQQIRDSQWTQALAQIEKVTALLPQNAVETTLQAPPYTAGFEKIDGDVQPVLLKLLQVPAWSFDLQDLNSDLSVKKSLLLRLTDTERKESLESYHQGIQKIQAKAWDEAMTFLKQVKVPEELKQDADQKIGLIERLMAIEVGVK